MKCKMGWVMEYSNWDDNQLVWAIAKGRQEAFVALIERYRRYIYGIAYKIVLNADDALDVTQSVYLKLAQKLHRYDGAGNFKAWLASLTARAAIDFQRKTKREHQTDPNRLIPILDKQTSDPVPPVWEQVETEEQTARVEKAMRQLSRQQRAVFMLAFEKDMASQDIAEELGLPRGHVRVQLHRATQAIKKIIRQENSILENK
ncbi:sigma-70 family RNA polymerase sigma factor [bacterium]|nr:sigma-70 family RNA polymerase sigma factor [bacterium]